MINEFNEFKFRLFKISISYHYIFMLECSDGYEQLISGSDECYKIVKEKKTWKKAKAECKKDGADLACFGNEKERDILVSNCDGCCVGYQWKGGKSALGGAAGRRDFTLLLGHQAVCGGV